LSVIDSFSTQHFTFKITFMPTAAPLRTVTIPFDLMTRAQTSYTSLPPRLKNVRMHANHHNYNALIGFLEERELGWPVDRAMTHGKRFVDGMSKALFQCNDATWKALNDKHNCGAMNFCCIYSAHFLFYIYCTIIY